MLVDITNNRDGPFNSIQESVDEREAIILYNIGRYPVLRGWSL